MQQTHFDLLQERLDIVIFILPTYLGPESLARHPELSPHRGVLTQEEPAQSAQGAGSQQAPQTTVQENGAGHRGEAHLGGLVPYCKRFLLENC